MYGIYAVLLLAGLVPLVRAWRRCRGTSLEHALYWLAAAWLGWGLALFAGTPKTVGWGPWRFVALALTCCPIVAALGARRPYVAAWNFVVLGLLAVLLLPLLEMIVLGSRTLDTLRLFFLAATLALGILNYLPTRFAPAALWSGAALALELWAIAAPDSFPDLPLPWAHLALLLTPQIAWLCSVGPFGRVGLFGRVGRVFEAHLGSDTRSDFDPLWLTFRDRYGVLWAQRVREQFNRAAANAGWKCHLTWFGLKCEASEGVREGMTETLHSLLKRFL
jgi:hypothetical protein